MMITRVLFAALIAGIAAGLVMSVVQHWKVTPLIAAAEQFESGDYAHDDHSPAETAQTGGQDEGNNKSWAQQIYTERTLFTVISNVISGVAFSLVLAGVIVLVGSSTSLSSGVMLGLLGFVTFSLAPSAGLYPNLPGMPMDYLADRQFWWWGTVIATGAGIGCLGLLENFAFKPLGVVLISLPHIIGAPQVDDPSSDVPSMLAAQFAANSLAVAALFWVVLGVILCWCLNWQKVNTA